MPCRTALADDVGGRFFSSSSVIGLTPIACQASRDPTTEIVPRPDAWTACPIRWNNRAVFTHSIIALLAKTMILLTMT
jgi:hypothetical protein